MVFISDRGAPERQVTSLRQFLAIAQTLRQQHPKAAWLSVSIPLPHAVDPLAALVELDGLNQVHTLWQHPRQQETCLGMGVRLSQTFAGAQRFVAAQAWIQEVFRVGAIAPGALPHSLESRSLESRSLESRSLELAELPSIGPRVFCSFSFHDQISDHPGDPWGGFAPATLLLPVWQLVNHAPGGHSQGWFVANLPSQPTGFEHAVQETWQVYEQLCRLPEELPLPLAVGLRLRQSQPAHLGESVGVAHRQFVEGVEAALAAIAAGDLQKVVLAQPLMLQAPLPFEVPVCLQTLRHRYPDCHLFSWGTPATQPAGLGSSLGMAAPTGSIFLGASPERLLSIRQHQLVTEAIAGSAPRGLTPTEDQQLGQQLLTSAKERYEHNLVADFIVEQLGQLGLTPQRSQLRLLRLSNIQHLHTPITAPLPKGLHPLALVAQLHPTPAVAGTPRLQACDHIRQWEPGDRGLYASPLGWIDAQGNSEFWVGIRSALLTGRKAHVFAGAGIVQGSIPCREQAEVELKLGTLWQVLLS